MQLRQIIELLSLAAIWGASFIFMRILAPVLGPILTANLRLLIAAVALLSYFAIVRWDVDWRLYWKEYLIIGAVNSALPFTLFAFAALHIPASYSAILNATAPLFGAIFSVWWLNDTFTLRKGMGLALGAIGVVLISRIEGGLTWSVMAVLAIIACLIATLCYALASIYIKKFASKVNPTRTAAASQLLAGLLLLPLTPLSLPSGPITSTIIFNLLGLALLCSAVAYVLYYRLLAQVGPSKALTVTFLIPVFGMLWSKLFLDEAITFTMLLACLLIISGTWLVVRSGKT